jgi:hypothetical protein
MQKSYYIIDLNWGLSWLSLLVFCLAVPAQTAPTKERNGVGYGFAAPVSFHREGAGLQLGAGGEGLVYRGLGIGAEISIVTTPRAFREGIGLLSPNVSYHFRGVSKGDKWVPFVTGGYTLFFRSGVANGINFGGGVNYWLKERLGLRFEVRDQVLPDDGAAHLVSFRAGISFR